MLVAWSRRVSRRDVRLVGLGGLLFCIVLAGALFLVGQRERARSTQEFAIRLGSRAAVNADAFAARLEMARREARFLASVPPVDGLVRAIGHADYDAQEQTPRALWQQRLTSIFCSYVTANPGIIQIRLIGTADNGRELVRVDQRSGQPVVVAPDQLQAKGDTEYMRMASRLPAGQVYVSDINLNREHGKVQQPHIATLRVATPVFTAQGRLFGVIVVNYDAATIMAPLGANLPDGFTAYLTNRSGDFLYHPDPSRSFGFDLGRRWRWHDQFVAQARPGTSVQLTRYASPGGPQYALSRKVALDATNVDRFVTLTLAVSEALVGTAVAHQRNNILLATFGSGLLICALGCLYLRQWRQVRNYQAHLSAIVESSDDAIIGESSAGLVTSWNKGAQCIFGYAAAQAIGYDLAALLMPQQDLDEDQASLARVLRGEIVPSRATELRRNNGELVAVSITTHPIKDAGGRVVGVARTVRDITEQLAADTRVRDLNASLEQQVRERTAQIETYSTLQRAILANATYAIVATGIDGTIVLFNPAAEKMLGYAADEVLGRQTPAIFHDATEVAARAGALSHELGLAIAPGFEVFVAKARLGLDNEHVWTYIRKDGSRLPVLLSVSALRGEDGAINGFLGISSDMSVREQDRRTLIAARDQLLAAADVAELGIWTWTLADDRLEWNERMYAFYDIPIAQRGTTLLSEHWRSRIHPDDVEAVVAKLRAALDGSDTYVPEFRVIQGDGQIRYIQAAASVERDAQGKAVRMQGINRDVTLQRAAEQTLQAAKLAADDANRAKSEFLANMSHEIRSPMNAVLGMLMLLKRTTLDRRQRDYADKAEAAGRALLGILNDILDFSRVEAGKLTLDPHPFSIDQLLRELAVILSANVGDKEIEILYRIDPALPDWVVGDALRLQQVLINLAGNAVKFTAQGEVAVSVRQLAAQTGTMRIGFAIADTGIGISTEQCQRIFDGFSQAEASTARRYGGSGLGLAICQRLVGLMGGTLGVDSTVGRGSTFHFEIDCQPAQEQPQAGQLSKARLQGLRCMVIDDNPGARDTLGEMLASFAWKVDALASGAEALDAIGRGGESAYDMIFVDWRMPGMDGWETCERIRSLSPSAKAPLIAMVTANGREQLAQRHAVAPGLLDGFLVKPVTPSMLFDAVAEAMANQAHGPPAARALARSTQRLRGLHLLVVEDNPTNQQVARELLCYEGARVDVADNGQAAIDAVRLASSSFDCVLMDVQMPGMDGYAATRAIRAGHPHALPIIAMTANALESDREAALAAGMDDHIGKPFDLDQLIAVILAHTGRGAAPVGAAVETLPVDDDAPGFDSVAALARLGGQREIYARALLGFGREVGVLAERLAASEPTLSRAEAGQILHTLRGLAVTVGARDLAKQAEQLERAWREPHWPASWDTDRKGLAGAAREAVAASVALASGFAAPPAARADQAPPELHALALPMRTLKAMLEASSLNALPLFEELNGRYGRAMGAEFFALENAIDALQFVAAAQLCDTILFRLAKDFP
jgi:two-component system sensor histidine kinase/response regulator